MRHFGSWGRWIAVPSLFRETLASGGNWRQASRHESAGKGGFAAYATEVPASTEQIYTIFEGTSEIQRLVISRAISGMRIR